jgi:hypothetical protein
MGSCSSCCGRRRPDPAHDEREPLLPKPTEFVPPKEAWDKVADALGALAAGKMPTQRQLDAVLSALLSSDMLKVGNTATGTLSAHGRRLVLDVRDVIQAVARIGMEKNGERLSI